MNTQPIRRRPGKLSKQKRGFILAAAIIACFLMVVIAFVIANQNRAMQGYTMSAQTETLEAEGARYAFTQLQGVLQHDSLAAAPAGAPSALGLPTPLTTTDTITGSTPGNDSNFTGQLTYQKLNGATGTDSYASTTGVSGTGVGTGIPSFNIPSDHSAAVLTASIESDSVKQKFVTIFTGNYPCGIVTTNSMNVASAHSSTGYDGQTASGVMANLSAKGTLTVGNLYGRAYSNSTTATVTDKTGIAYPSWPGAGTMPGDFTQALNTWKTTYPNSTTSTDLTLVFDHLHAALHGETIIPPGGGGTSVQTLFALGAAAYGFQVLNWPPDALFPVALANPASGVLYVPPLPSQFANATVNAQGTDYDGSYSSSEAGYSRGTLTVTTSLTIPSGKECTLFGFNSVNIAQDLVIQDNAYLSINNNLVVTGNIYLGKNSTLAVAGTTTAASLGTSYTLAGSNNVGLCSTFLGTGGLTITNGMQKSTLSGPSGGYVTQVDSASPYPTTVYPVWMFSILLPPYMAPSPVPDADSQTALNDGWTLKYNADWLQLGPVGDNINSYLGGVSESGTDTTDVPGIFTFSDNTITFSSGAKVSGLLYTPATVNLGTVQKAVGSIWTGTLDASRTDFMYFPYYTHAFVRTPGNLNTTISAIEQHSAAYGRVQ